MIHTVAWNNIDKDSDIFELKNALYGPTNEAVKIKIKNIVLIRIIYLFISQKKTRFHIKKESR